MYILALSVAALQFSLAGAQLRDPCPTGVWLVAGVDVFLAPGAWTVTVCRNGAFSAVSGESTTEGALSNALQGEIRRELRELPREFEAYSYGQQTVDSRMLLLLVPDGKMRRTYQVGDILPPGSCASSCAAVLRITKRLYGLLPLAARDQAIAPWSPQRPR